MRGLLIACCLIVCSVATAEPQVQPAYRIELPKDAGSHPEFATEWWYLTGWFKDDAGAQRGFQITFFRSRNPAADGNPSKFAPRQILFAHTALSDPARGHLLRAERTARTGFDLAEATQGNLDVKIDGWHLRAEGERIVAEVSTNDFALSLELQTTQSILLQGDNGYSRKGPDSAASHYYSLPQMRVQGALLLSGKRIPVTGQAWFDHEWSNVYVDAASVGWDWIGLNLNDGGALMSFRMRDTEQHPRWAAATWRLQNSTRTFAPDQIAWTALQHWRSPRTGVTYPVSWRIKVGAREFTVRPLMNDQENDARGSVGILYWEGAVEAFDSTGAMVGRGYLELTGYGEVVQF